MGVPAICTKTVDTFSEACVADDEKLIRFVTQGKEKPSYSAVYRSFQFVQQVFQKTCTQKVQKFTLSLQEKQFFRRPNSSLLVQHHRFYLVVPLPMGDLQAFTTLMHSTVTQTKPQVT